MSSVFGKNIILSVFGESHSQTIGATIHNIQPGVKIDNAFIKNELYKRRPRLEIHTPRAEEDDFSIISGVFNGYTTGAPLTILIKNTNISSKNYHSMKGVVRPSHADYAAYLKYNGYNDYRGGGHFSGRITAPIVATCAICKQILKSSNINIIAHIKSIGNINSIDLLDLEIDDSLVEKLEDSFPVVDDKIKDKMIDEIIQSKNQGDSIGGSVQVLVTGLKPGFGNPIFESVEAKIASAMYAIGGIKAIEFGKGISTSKQKASEANDQLTYYANKVTYLSNNNGGINGGISNGDSISFTVYFKPTPTINISQNTIDIINQTNREICMNGRHDPCIVPRAVHVVSNLCAFTILDLIGGNSNGY